LLLFHKYWHFQSDNTSNGNSLRSRVIRLCAILANIGFIILVSTTISVSQLADVATHILALFTFERNLLAISNNNLTKSADKTIRRNIFSYLRLRNLLLDLFMANLPLTIAFSTVAKLATKDTLIAIKISEDFTSEDVEAIIAQPFIASVTKISHLFSQ
jgi:hypothetical protein